MRAFTPQAAAAVRTATTFVTIKNLSGTADELVAARSPLAQQDSPAPAGPARAARWSSPRMAP